MIISRMICEHIRLLKMTGGGTSEELLRQLGNYAIEQGLAREGFTEGLLNRERNFPTGIQGLTGIAIPHSEQEYTIKPTIVIVTLDEATEFRPMCGGDIVPVETVFLLLLDQAEKQVEMLGNIVGLIEDEEKMGALRSMEKPEEIISSFEQFLS